MLSLSQQVISDIAPAGSLEVRCCRLLKRNCAEGSDRTLGLDREEVFVKTSFQGTAQ